MENLNLFQLLVLHKKRFYGPNDEAQPPPKEEYHTPHAQNPPNNPKNYPLRRFLPARPPRPVVYLHPPPF